MARKTSIPVEHGPDPAQIPLEDRVRQIDPSSEEGRRIFEELEKDLPENFGNPKKKHPNGLHYHDPSRNKHKIVESWGEGKILKEWVKDPRCVCKVVSVIKGRLRSKWTPERAMSTPYKGIFS